MSVETQAHVREKVRVLMTGSCEGLAELKDALERHLEVELVAWSEHAADAASVLAGGHLGVVLHGTQAPRSPSPSSPRSASTPGRP